MEVSDDGCGVPLESRPLLATPHATSKIRSFEEIYSNSSQTLGFRGEALFCLANLSASLVVATRTAGEPLAQKMEFRRDGSLLPNTVTRVPKKVGTTVAVVRLFDAVPVRRLDLKRRIADQRRKLVRLISGYAVFCPGVRFQLMDINTVKGNQTREHVLLATPAQCHTIPDTVSAVFGSRFWSSLAEFRVDLTELIASSDKAQGEVDKDSGDSQAQSCQTEATQAPPVWKVHGYISRFPNGSQSGNSNERFRDEQLYSINSRPVDLPRFSRMFAEVWRSLCGPNHSSRSHPSCVLEFTLPNNAYDVNVSPDKREVILPKESELLDLLQHHVLQHWSSQIDGQFESAACLTNRGASSFDDGSENDTPSKFNRRYAFSHDVRKIRLQHEYDDGRVRSSEEKLDSRKPLPASSSQDSDDEEDYASAMDTAAPTADDDADQAEGQKHCGTDDSDAQNKTHTVSSVSTKPTVEVTPGNLSRGDNEWREQELPEKRRFGTTGERSEADDRIWRAAKRRFHESSMVESRIAERLTFSQFRAASPATQTGRQMNRRLSAVPTSHTLERFGFRAQNDSSRRPQAGKEDQKIDGPFKRVSFDSGSTLPIAGVTGPSSPVDDQVPHVEDIVTVELDRTVDTTGLASRQGAQEEQENQGENNQQVGTADRSVNPIVWDSFSNTRAVAEAAHRERIAMVDRRISFQSVEAGGIENVPGEEENGGKISLRKGDFETMEVIGQFNMGFILAKSCDNHLWIMDQHACDEKYKFEKLVAETVIHEQPLIAPMPMELSIAEECCILDNMEIFEKNGFRFHYDAEKPPRQRLFLTAIPHSGARDGRKAVLFGKEDVSALCAILGSDDTGTSHDITAGSGTGTDGSGMYGNNAVRRYVSRSDTTNSSKADRVIARLPKAIAMFASRACRGSIMIGKALSVAEMDRVVKHLAEIDHPWNCPHGRPTMRHAADLRPLMADDERTVTARLAGPTVTILSQEMEAVDDVGLTQEVTL